MKKILSLVLLLQAFSCFADKATVEKIKTQLASENAYARKAGAESAKNLETQELLEIVSQLQASANEPQGIKNSKLTPQDRMAQISTLQALQKVAPVKPEVAEFLFDYAARYRSHSDASFSVRDFIESNPKIFEIVATKFLNSKKPVEIEMAVTVLIKSGSKSPKLKEAIEPFLTLEGLKKAQPELFSLTENFGKELSPAILKLLSDPKVIEEVKILEEESRLNFKKFSDQKRFIENLDQLLKVLAQDHPNKEEVIATTRKWKSIFEKNGFDSAVGTTNEILAKLTSGRKPEKKYIIKPPVQNVDKLINAIEISGWPKEDIPVLREALEREPLENLQDHLSKINKANPRYYNLLLDDMKTENSPLCPHVFSKIAG